ncbi:Divalent-cation tolerance protein CutA [Rubripirellula tenax]|uniref:Divalent-cation tolerance protein CutA n=1 Tax=Rubripirellula tenax TaxID=2528015 RepID=A0A5C6EMV6_9BACT|nr:divalent-cation tolerance protein CutA [Rubripirellula tenax]TWU51063.1 Divalent-cation tolerance protein CutA [Rubripirellula tenax]
MANETQSIVIANTTVATTGDAEAMARELIGQSIAACVQIDGPITSHYRWAGEVQQSTEFRLTIKTSMATWPKLKERLARIHPYDEPEILMTVVDDASDGYRQWVIDQTT